MGMVRRLLWGLAALLITVSALQAAKKELVIGVENLNYYPYYDFSGKQYSGFFKELMERFGKAKGYQILFKPLPVKRLYSELLESGQIDFKFPDNPHWGGEYKKGKTVLYSDGVVLFIDGVLVRPENREKDIGTIRRLGTIAGFTPWTFMDRIKKGTVENVEVRTMPALLKTTMAGRIDGAYVNISVARYILEDVLGKKGKLLWNPNLPYDKAYYNLSTLHYPEILDEFNAFLREEKAMVKALEKQFKIEIGE